MRKKLLIVGAGGCGREVAQIAKDTQALNTVDWELYGFLNDDLNALRGVECNVPMIGSIQHWEPKSDEIFICAIGTPEYREKLTVLLEGKGAQFTSLIHPTAVISNTARYEQGLVVYPYSCISANASIGRHVLINMHNAIGHDASIGDYSVLSSFCDITGYVKVGTKVFLGSHATIAPKLKIGDSAHVGIGSVVVNSIRAGKNVFGNPAKSLSI